jgi:hypothetical protein
LPLKIKSTNEIVERVLTLNIIAGVSYGLDISSAKVWLEKEKLIDKLTKNEVAFLNGDMKLKNDYKYIVEALYLFCWTLSMVSHFDMFEGCPDNLILNFPNILKNETSEKFRSKSILRSENQISNMLDMSYCLDWATTNAVLHKSQLPIKFEPLGLKYRRRAIEWLSSSEAWDEIILDT